MNKLADPTFAELRGIKEEIQTFVDEVFKPNTEHVRNYFINICKKVVLTKYLDRQVQTDYRYKALLSDLCYLLNSIECGEIRYFYLNVRSIIEQSLRITVDVESTDSMTFNELVEKLIKLKESVGRTLQINTDIIQEEYAKACLYIHGNSLANMELAEFYMNTFGQTKTIEKLDVKLHQLCSVLKSIFSLLLISKSEMVDGAFHRRKTILKYLIGDNRIAEYVISRNA